MGRKVLNALLGLVGAAVGAYLGVVLFGWIWWHHFYALVIPGAALGLGCHLTSPDRSTVKGILCGVMAVVLGYYTEWRYRPWEEPHEGLSYFVTHLPDLWLFTHVMIIVGALMAFWWGREASPWLAFRRKPKSIPE